MSRGGLAPSNTVSVSRVPIGSAPPRVDSGYNRSMSLVQLESFVAVAREGHLGRAAARLHVSQPPLTRRIRSLEEELGVELFERTHRGMKLLPPGERLLEHAVQILERVERARCDVTSMLGAGPPGVAGLGRDANRMSPRQHRDRADSGAASQSGSVFDVRRQP